MAASSSSLPDVQQRAWRYWFADGLAHIVFGVCVLLFAFCNFLIQHRLGIPWAMGFWLASFAALGVVLIRHREIVEWLKTKTTYPRTGYVQVPFPKDSTSPVSLLTPSLHEARRSAFRYQVRSLVGALFGDLAGLVTIFPHEGSAIRPEEALRLQANAEKRQVLSLVLVTLACLATFAIGEKRVPGSSPWAWSAAGILVGAAAWVVRRDYRLSWLIVLGLPVIGFCMTIFLAAHIRGPDRLLGFMGGWGLLFLLDGAITLIRYILRNPLPREPVA